MSGCNSQPPAVIDSAQKQYQLLGRYYGEYLSGHGGRAPTDQEELVLYLQQFNEFLESLGFARPADLLISPRDSQPLHVLYGSDVIDNGPGGLPWIAYEEEGIKGNRYLIGARGVATELSPEEFAETTSQPTKR